MRYKPKSIAALHVVLGGLPDKMQVEVDPGIQPSPKTVGLAAAVAVMYEPAAMGGPPTMEGLLQRIEHEARMCCP